MPNGWHFQIYAKQLRWALLNKPNPCCIYIMGILNEEWDSIYTGFDDSRLSMAKRRFRVHRFTIAI
jgi:hypothetical protein